MGDRRIIVVAGIAKRFSGSLSREIYYYEAERGRRLSHCTHADNNRFARNIRIDLDVDLPDNNGRNVRHRRHGSLAFLFARGSKPCTHTHTHTHTPSLLGLSRILYNEGECPSLSSLFILFESSRAEFMAEREAIFHQMMRNVLPWVENYVG